jgi:hypothetical protein
MKKWLAPVLTLSVLPKCPGCIAAYIALSTGLGVSFTTAVYIRDALLALCIASMLYLTVRSISDFRSLTRTRASDTAHGHCQ